MEKIKNHAKEIGVVNSVCLFLVTIYEIYVLFTMDNNPILMTASVLSVIAYIFGIFYTIKGSTKAQAAYYKIFMMLFLLAALLCTVELIANEEASNVKKIAYIISVILLILLSVVDNLGKSKTFYLGLIVLTIYFMCWVYEIINAYNPFTACLHTLGKVFLSGAACLFISAKYEDKDKRGTI